MGKKKHGKPSGGKSLKHKKTHHENSIFWVKKDKKGMIKNFDFDWDLDFDQTWEVEIDHNLDDCCKHKDKCGKSKKKH